MKISKIISVTVVVLLVGLGWYYYSYQQESVEQSKPSETVYSDSIDAPDRPSITAQKDTTPEPVGEDLAPGTALVEAKVLNVNVDDGGDGPKHITVRVEEVKGYGSSTSPISSKTELNIDVQNVVNQDTDVSKRLQEGADLLMVISGRQQLQTGASANESDWGLLEIITQ